MLAVILPERAERLAMLAIPWKCAVNRLDVSDVRVSAFPA